MSSFLEVASQPAAALTPAIFAGAILLAMALLVSDRVLKPDEGVQGFDSPALKR